MRPHGVLPVHLRDGIVRFVARDVSIATDSARAPQTAPERRDKAHRLPAERTPTQKILNELVDPTRLT